MSGRVSVIKGLTASWCGGPDGPVQVEAVSRTGDGDMVTLRVTAVGRPTEAGASIDLQVRLQDARELSAVIAATADATQHAELVEGVGTDGQPRSVDVVRELGPTGPTWLTLIGRRAEAVEDHVPVVFKRAGVQEARRVLEEAVALAEKSTAEREWEVTGVHGHTGSIDGVAREGTVTSSTMKARVSFQHPRRVGVSVTVTTTADVAGRTQDTWLPLVDARRLIAHLTELMPER